MSLHPDDRRTLRIFWRLVAATAVVAAVIGGAWSRSYWGYWYVFPSVPAAIAEARSVRHLTPLTFDDQTCALAVGPEIDLPSSVLNGRAYADGRFNRMLAHLHDRGLGLAHARPDPTLSMAALSAELRARGDVRPGASPHYRQAMCLSGGAVTVVDDAGRESLVVGVSSGDIANDHHATYEITLARVDGAWRVREMQTTFFDVAGLEGLTWWTMAGMLFFPLLAWLAITYKITRFVFATVRGFKRPLPAR
jgi:hypothetical protein